MVDKICDKLMNQVRSKMPEVDDERAEVIRYGFELIIGEIPKLFIVLIVASICGILKYTLISLVTVSLYRVASGGIHMKGHIGCMLATTFLYIGTAIISNIIVFENFTVRVIFYITVYLFALIMITLYAPADTDNVPILRKKVRSRKKVISYILVSAYTLASFFIQDDVITNILMIGILLQSITISGFAYKVFKVKFGYLEYIKTKENA